MYEKLLSKNGSAHKQYFTRLKHTAKSIASLALITTTGRQAPASDGGNKLVLGHPRS